MDAARAVSSITGLIFNCATAVQACNDLHGKYKTADQTLGSIATEGSTLQDSLLHLQHLMLHNPAALSSRWDVKSMLPQTFETAIESFAKVLAALHLELEKYNGKGGSSSGTALARSLKIKLLWNENAMQDVLVRLRAHQQSLQFLLAILQMGSISEIRNGIQKNQELLRKLARSTRELERQQSESFQRKTRPREDYENPIASIEEDTSEKDTNSDEDRVREPPAKRRSISPEEKDVNTAPSPSRTRSGRVYYPVMTSTYPPVSQNTRATSNVEQQSVENLANKITISTGKQSQHTSDYHRLRSRDQIHKRQQDKSRYSLGRSLSPASSTLGSPLTQSPSATHTGEPRFPNSLGSPSHHQTYKPQTPPDTPNKSGKGKAVDTAPLHPPGSSSRTIMTATSVEQSVESEHMNRKNEMCIDLSTMPSTLPQTSQINLNPAIPQNYRSPQIESDSEEAPPDRVDNCFIPKLLQENLKDLSSRNSGRAHEDSDEDLAPAQSSEKTPHRPTGAFSSRYNSSRFDATVRKQNSWSAPREEGNQRNSEPFRASYGDSDKNEYANHLVDGVVYRVPNHRLENSAYKPYGGGINQDYSSKACQQYSSGDDSHHTNATPSPQRRPTRPQSSSQYPKQEMISEATEADARKHRIPPGYSLKNWNPLEEPIMLLGSVFDANNLGKWINDWTIYYHGPATALVDMAGEIWRLLTELASKVKRAEECMPQIRMAENREMVNDFIESRERLIDKLKKLLTSCEISMLKARERYGKDLGYSSKNAEMEFIDSMFGRDRQLEATEKFMASMRLWNLRFDANCEDILRRPEQ